jgi:lipase maturation factor 1
VDTGANRFGHSASLFLRALAVIHLIAFASAGMQLAGLVGPHGLLPAEPFFRAVHAQLGPGAYLDLPSLCWIVGAGAALPIICVAGMVLAGLLLAGVAPALCLAGLWAGYLTICSAGQVFFSYQWDYLLLEATFAAIFLAPWTLRPLWRRCEPPRLARWVLWWLLFRLIFVSGAVKLASGDATWRTLSALTFHYETQPLPTPLAWYVHQWPAWFQRACCAVMFAIELVAPFCLFGPRRLRHGAALSLIALMIAIELTGNYTFFNLLTIALCLLCLDDAWWAWVRRRPAAAAVVVEIPLRAAPTGLLHAYSVFAIAFTGLTAVPRLAHVDFLPGVLGPLDTLVGPFRSLNNYGLFAVMTNPRPELLIQGSDDGRDWRTYELPDKPGDRARAPTWVAPFQPRLDWQLWFAALEAPSQNRWVLTLCEQLLRGTPETLALFARNPFPQKPPHWVRVVRYEYHFTDAAARARTGEWWRSSPLDFYVEPASLR